MDYINDTETNIIYEENKETDNWGNIVTFLDFNGVISRKLFLKYLNCLIESNDILHKNIVKRDQNNFFEDHDIDIKKYYNIKKCSYKLFDKKTYYVLNRKYNTNWFFHVYADSLNNKSRLYFTINHAYADGYKIISLLTSTIKNSGYKKPSFKRKSKNYYYILIGTCILIFAYIKTLYNIYNKPKKHITIINKTDFISLNLNFSKVKLISEKNKISLNDLLYSLTIRTHYHYFKKEKNIFTASPFSTGDKNKTNNFKPLFTEINNNLTITNLFQKVNNIFNCYKFSVFVIILEYIYNIMGNVICRQVYTKITDNLDILYTNMIGPDKNEIHDQYNNCLAFNKKKITMNNIHFLMNHKKNEINVNIISYDTNINIILSFPENIYDKEKLLTAFDDAYTEIIKL